MSELGYDESRNLDVAFHFISEGEGDQLPAVVRRIIAAHPDVVVAIGPDAALELKRATSTIPIVVAAAPDPVERGLVESYSRPGGNITGVAPLASGLGLKRLEMLKEAVPDLSRVAVLSTPGWDSRSTSKGRQWVDLQAAAREVGVNIFVVEARETGSGTDTTNTVLEAIAEAKLRGADGLLLLVDAVLESRRSLIAQAAQHHALPGMFYRLEFAEEGGLLAYAPDTLSEYRLVAQFVVQIINGANPAELPIARQTHYETVLNLDTAQELGLEIPSSFLFKVTKFIGGAQRAHPNDG